MKRVAIAFAITLTLVSTLFVVGSRRVAATPQIEYPSGDKLRFRLVGDEPIAGPDGRSIVPGWKVLVFQDLKSSRCYVTFTHDGNPTAAGEMPCIGRQPAR
jgi:hypothetical protein